MRLVTFRAVPRVIQRSRNDENDDISGLGCFLFD